MTVCVEHGIARGHTAIAVDSLLALVSLPDTLMSVAYSFFFLSPMALPPRKGGLKGARGKAFLTPPKPVALGSLAACRAGPGILPR